MSDIVERLLAYASDDHERGCPGRQYICSCGYDDKRDPLLTEAAAVIGKERIENVQMRAALGYPIPADLERHIMSNPFQCGTCGPKVDTITALRSEVERLRAELHTASDMNAVYEARLQEKEAENERLRKDLSLSIFADSEYCKVLEREQERLLKSRNRWAQKYNDLLNKQRAKRNG